MGRLRFCCQEHIWVHQQGYETGSLFQKSVRSGIIQEPKYVIGRYDMELNII
jgi:hypothetical protein